MDWTKVKKVPMCNPLRFELVRNLDGMAKWEFAKRANLSTKRYSDIENGNVEPTKEEFEKIVKSQTRVLETFFMTWDETMPDFSRGYGINVPVDYYKFKIFRDVNPPPLSIVWKPTP